MPEKFKDKYRIPSNRLRGWNYASNGHYYITIVTSDRKRLFGEIVNGEMMLNDWGQIVYDEFFKSFELRVELFLGEFVLMPDHLHAIVIMDKTKCTDIGANGDGLQGDLSHGDVWTHGRVWAHNRVEKHGRASLPQPQQPQPTSTQFQRQPKSISSFVAGFKSATVKRIDDWIDANHPAMARFNRNNPLWQSNYHDHIIRNEAEYQRISEYIVRNPIDWEEEDSYEAGMT